MKKVFLYLQLIIIIFSLPIFAQPHHKLLTKILADNVKDGFVNYKGLENDSLFIEYIKQLKSSNPGKLKSSADRLAFWINAYNAYTIKIILDNYPIESINELHSGGRILAHIFKSTVWDKDFVVINKRKMTLNEIEHEIIRKKFKEPRIHFALVCASISCPSLRNEAYEGYKLNEQLEDQAKIFFNDRTKNKFDLKNRTAFLSKILDWYDSDFGNNDEEVLLFVAKYLPEKLSKDIQENTEEWDIDYLPYSWDLNEIKK